MEVNETVLQREWYRIGGTCLNKKIIRELNSF